MSHFVSENKSIWSTNNHPATVKLQAELNRIRKLIAWNGFQNGKAKYYARKLENIKTSNNKNQSIKENSANADVICINLPYLGEQGDQYTDLQSQF